MTDSRVIFFFRSVCHVQCDRTALKLKNRFQVVVRLNCNRSQMTFKCGEDKKVAHEAQSSASLMFYSFHMIKLQMLLKVTASMRQSSNG